MKVEVVPAAVKSAARRVESATTNCPPREAVRLASVELERSPDSPPRVEVRFARAGPERPPRAEVRLASAGLEALLESRPSAEVRFESSASERELDGPLPEGEPVPMARGEPLRL